MKRIKVYCKAFLLAIIEYTRIPVPVNLKFAENGTGKSANNSLSEGFVNISFNNEIVGTATIFLPVIGWLIGAILLGAEIVIKEIYSIELTALLLNILLLWLTGGLHVDGLIDLFDGLGANRDKEKTLEIMQDSRVGAFGVIGFVSFFLLKLDSLTEILIFSAEERTLAGGEDSLFFGWVVISLLIVPILSRWGVLLSIYQFPYARKDGMGRLVKEGLTIPKLIIATIWLIPIVFIVIFWHLSVLTILYLFAVILLFNLLLGSLLTKRLGGLTGDIYGFLIEGGEAILWLFIAGLR